MEEPQATEVGLNNDAYGGEVTYLRARAAELEEELSTLYKERDCSVLIFGCKKLLITTLNWLYILAFRHLDI